MDLHGAITLKIQPEELLIVLLKTMQIQIFCGLVPGITD